MNVTTDEFLLTIFADIQASEAVCLARREEGVKGLPGYAWQPGGPQTADYFCVSSVLPRRGMLRRRAADAMALYCIYLDDIGGKYPEPSVPPSWVLETSEGNFQWGYLLSAALEGDEARDAVATWSAICDGRSDPIASMTRIGRVPGAVHKTGFIARVTQWHPERHYEVAELAALFHVEHVTAAGAPPDGETVYADDPLRDWLREQGWRTGEDGMLLSVCPWVAEHTTEGGDAAYFPLGYRGRANRGFHCLHAHCAQRGIQDFTAWAVAEGAPLVTTYSGEPLTGTIAALMATLPLLSRAGLPDLRVGGRGQPLTIQPATARNIEWLLSALDITARTNVMLKRVELSAPWAEDAHTVEVVLLNVASTLGMDAEDRVTRRAHDKAREHMYHPIIEGLPAWDGVDHIAALADTVQVVDQSLWRIYLRKWIRQAVRAWNGFDDPVQVSAVLVLAGKQGIGKTRWFERLHPAVNGGVTLTLTNKDSIIECLSMPIAELGELESTFRKSDVTHLKAFLSKTSDTYRAPYGRAAETWPRVTVFGGSVNTVDFLQDATGNRRYWVVEALAVDPKHTLDMGQVWAQAKAEIAAGKRWWLTPDEEERQKASAEDFRAVSSVEESLVECLDAWEDAGHALRLVNAGDLLRAIGQAHNNSHRDRSLVVNLLTARHGKIRKMRLTNGGRRKGWMVPVPAEVHIAGQGSFRVGEALSGPQDTE